MKNHVLIAKSILGDDLVLPEEIEGFCNLADNVQSLIESLPNEKELNKLDGYILVPSSPKYTKSLQRIYDSKGGSEILTPLNHDNYRYYLFSSHKVSSDWIA